MFRTDFAISVSGTILQRIIQTPIMIHFYITKMFLKVKTKTWGKIRGNTWTEIFALSNIKKYIIHNILSTAKFGGKVEFKISSI